MPAEEAYVLSVDICGYSAHLGQPDELARIGFRLRRSYDHAQTERPLTTAAPPQLLGDELRVAFPCSSTSERDIEDFIVSHFLPHLRSTRFQVRTSLVAASVRPAMFRDRWPYLRGKGAHIAAGMLKNLPSDHIASTVELQNSLLLEPDAVPKAPYGVYVYKWAFDARAASEVSPGRPDSKRVPILALNAGIDSGATAEDAGA